MTKSPKVKRLGVSPQVRITSNRSRTIEEIEKKVSAEVNRLLGNKAHPVPPFLIDWGRRPNPVLPPRGTCPVCKCPDYQWLPIEDRTPRRVVQLLGIVSEAYFSNWEPKPTYEWVCAHCVADQQFLQGPVMWSELLDLRESVVVDNLSYQDFCEQELRLFERYMTPEDITFSDHMETLAAAASFTVEYKGQPRSLRTGLLVRRFQILQELRQATREHHD